MTNHDLVRQILRKTRRDKDKSLREIAEHVGLSASTICRYEKGSLALTAERLAELLAAIAAE